MIIDDEGVRMSRREWLKVVALVNLEQGEQQITEERLKSILEDGGEMDKEAERGMWDGGAAWLERAHEQ